MECSFPKTTRSRYYTYMYIFCDNPKNPKWIRLNLHGSCVPRIKKARVAFFILGTHRLNTEKKINARLRPTGCKDFLGFLDNIKQNLQLLPVVAIATEVGMQRSTRRRSAAPAVNASPIVRTGYLWLLCAY